MDIFAFFQAEQHIRDTDNLLESDYLNQLHNIEEKFKIWQNMKFLERAKIFKKVEGLSRYHNDMLSEWVVGEMEILLNKSDVA
ncbi:acyl-CoA reductase-like NAD-dependent aldehyde dehydrogenase [Pedobacter sp. UYP30]|uniref:hypothetical protein n=1 Tax=Pedobacter sp. UYP30 TaxID=1756400 RepID=UPI003397A36E